MTTTAETSRQQYVASGAYNQIILVHHVCTIFVASHMLMGASVAAYTLIVLKMQPIACQGLTKYQEISNKAHILRSHVDILERHLHSVRLTRERGRHTDCLCTYFQTSYHQCWLCAWLANTEIFHKYKNINVMHATSHQSLHKTNDFKKKIF